MIKHLYCLLITCFNKEQITYLFSHQSAISLLFVEKDGLLFVAFNFCEARNRFFKLENMDILRTKIDYQVEDKSVDNR